MTLFEKCFLSGAALWLLTAVMAFFVSGSPYVPDMSWMAAGLVIFATCLMVYLIIKGAGAMFWLIRRRGR